jgi:hypothetical protein
MPNRLQTVDSLLDSGRPRSTADFVNAAGINQSLSGRWGSGEVFVNGFLAVPVLFLKSYASLNPPLTPAEAIFVMELMAYKWTKDHPYPSFEALAKRMNVTDKMVRRYAQKLEDKHYLRRIFRKNKTNEFDLSGLFAALRSIAVGQKYDSWAASHVTAGKGRKIQ